MPIRILFVCYENICRSPMAEGAFGHLACLMGLSDTVKSESAGTVCYQSGSSPDSRALRAAGSYGIDISMIRARCIDDLDLDAFERIFVMDFENHRDLLDHPGNSAVPVHLMTEFAGDAAGEEIEDPYYGDQGGFDRTMERLMQCARGILEVLQVEHGLQGAVDGAERLFQSSGCGDER